MLLFLLVCYLVYLPTDWHLLIGDKCDNDYGRQKKSCSINTNIFFLASYSILYQIKPSIVMTLQLIDVSCQMYYLNANGNCLTYGF